MNEEQDKSSKSTQSLPSKTAAAGGVEAVIAFYAHHPEQINARIEELDREWDAAQLVATGAAGISFLGLLSGITRRSRTALLPLLAAQGVLFYQFIHPSPRVQAILQRLGVRGRREIEAQRYALKALRGDFQSLPPSLEARGSAPVLEAVRR